MDIPSTDTCGQCGKALGASVSRYFCTDACQNIWYARHAVHKAEVIPGSDSGPLSVDDHPTWLRLPGAVQPERAAPKSYTGFWMPGFVVPPNRDEAA